MKLKVAIIAINYVDQLSVKHKFVSRNEAFDYLAEHYGLSEDQLTSLEMNLNIEVIGTDNDLIYDFYLIEW